MIIIEGLFNLVGLGTKNFTQQKNQLIFGDIALGVLRIGRINQVKFPNFAADGLFT